MKATAPKPPLPSEARLERIPQFAGAFFEKSVVDMEGLPEITGPEIAFAGRSNSGKSSSINKLAGQTRLAFASKMPGRTRELNFFPLRAGGYLVDLPGYGFARTPRDKQRVWTGVIEQYFRERSALRGLVLVIDVRRGTTDLDVQFVEWMDGLGAGRPRILWLLNKCDKLTQSERMKARNGFRDASGTLVNERDSVVLFSAHTGLGMKECSIVFNAWLDNPPELDTLSNSPS
jgi:GTP-binding protein